MKNLLLFCFSFLLLTTLQAQNLEQPDQTPDMETDRPGQTESPKTVPKGMLQFESGFLWEQDRSGGVVENEYRYPATIIRIGVLKFAELRLKGEFKRNTKELEDGDIDISKGGFGRTGLGLKLHLWEEKGWLPEAGFLFHAIVPWGSQRYNSKYLEPDAMFTFANSLTENLSLSYSIGGNFESHEPEENEPKPRKYDHVFYYTAQLSQNFSDQLMGFVEYYGQKQEQQKLAHHLDGGLAWKLKPNLQLDILGGIGIGKDAPSFFVESGVSFRLPR